jgi:GPH family glycoside/pentoside/hexuronide:cation symporter
MTASTLTTQRLRVPFVTKIAYAFGDLAGSLIATITGFFLSAYLLEVAGLRPAAVATIFLIANTWDALNDPLMGSLIDRTRSRLGRRRPWLLFSAVPLGLVFLLYWYVPALDATGLFFYYLLVAILFKTAWTAVMLPYQALVPALTDDYDERTRLNTYRSSFGLVGSFLAIIFHPILTGLSDDPITGHLIVGALGGLLVIAAVLICFAFTYEDRSDQAPTERLDLGRAYASVLRNRPFLMVLGIYLASGFVIQLVQNNLLLFFRYYAGVEDQFTLVLLIFQALTVVFLSVWAAASRRVDKGRVYVLGVVIWAIALVCLYFAPPGNVPVYLFIAGLTGAGAAIGFLMPLSMLPDVIEYDQLQTGRRREGVYYGILAFLQQAGVSLGLSLSGFALEAAGYINPETAGAAVTQPDSVPATLRLLVGLVPAAILLVSIPLALLYPITRQKYADIRQQLEDRASVGAG